MTRLGLKMTIAILLAVVLILPGCSNKNENSQARKPQSTSSEKPKAPSEMKSIITDLEKIIAGLGKKVKMSSKSILQQDSQISTETEQQSNNSKGQQGQEEQSQQGQGEQSQQGQADQNKSSPVWQEEVSRVKKIHQNWNTVEPETVKAGMSISERDSFEMALEKLTLEIGQQNTETSLRAAIELYGQYANLVKVFDMPVPSELYKLKYELMAASAAAGKKEWQAALERIPLINEYWNHLKVKAKAKDEKLKTRTEFSIQDMIDALQSKEIDLILVKAEIVMNNLQKLEKELSSQKSTQS